MANDKLFFIDLDNTSPTRFELSKFMEFSDNFDPITSNFFFRLKALPIGGRFVVQGEEGRPDLIAFNALGDVQFWWVILLYNDVLDVDDIVNGDTLN